MGSILEADFQSLITDGMDHFGWTEARDREYVSNILIADKKGGRFAMNSGRTILLSAVKSFCRYACSRDGLKTMDNNCSSWITAVGKKSGITALDRRERVEIEDLLYHVYGLEGAMVLHYGRTTF